MATADRCDSCGGKPAYRYERDADYLVMCDNHGREHGQALRLRGWSTYRVAEVQPASVTG